MEMSFAADRPQFNAENRDTGYNLVSAGWTKSGRIDPEKPLDQEYTGREQAPYKSKPVQYHLY